MQVCSFPNEEGSNVYLVALDTLASTKPTLAVLAFQALIPYVQPEGKDVQPANEYCSQQLGGTVAANTPTSYLPIPGSSAGWWRQLGNGMWYGVNDFCVFADGSAIDPWTLMYHANTNTSAGVPSGSGIKFAYSPQIQDTLVGKAAAAA